MRSPLQRPISINHRGIAVASVIENIVKRGYPTVLAVDSILEVSDKLRGNAVGSVS